MRLIAWYSMILICINSIEVILGDWRDIGAGSTVNLTKLPWVGLGREKTTIASDEVTLLIRRAPRYVNTRAPMRTATRWIEFR